MLSSLGYEKDFNILVEEFSDNLHQMLTSSKPISIRESIIDFIKKILKHKMYLNSDAIVLFRMLLCTIDSCKAIYDLSNTASNVSFEMTFISAMQFVGCEIDGLRPNQHTPLEL